MDLNHILHFIININTDQKKKFLWKTPRHSSRTADQGFRDLIREFDWFLLSRQSKRKCDFKNWTRYYRTLKDNSAFFFFNHLFCVLGIILSFMNINDLQKLCLKSVSTLHKTDTQQFFSEQYLIFNTTNHHYYTVTDGKLDCFSIQGIFDGLV